jgi:hypothetical protein
LIPPKSRLSGPWNKPSVKLRKGTDIPGCRRRCGQDAAARLTRILVRPELGALAGALIFGLVQAGIFLDEPTSALGVKQASMVPLYVARAEGLGVVFITRIRSATASSS